MLAKGLPHKAAAAYDQALKLISSDDSRAGPMHVERAACFMQARQYADVVVEATRALKLFPQDPTALFYRAKAYESLGEAKKAKADATAAAAGVPTTENGRSAVESAKRMLNASTGAGAGAGAGPVGLGGMGLSAPKKAAGESKKEVAETAEQAARRRALEQQRADAIEQQKRQRAWGPPVAVKASCGDDIRVVIVPSEISHKDLMTTLQRKFPDQSAFVVRYTDAEGNVKPLNKKKDIADAIAAAQKLRETEPSDARPTLHNLPVLKLTVVELNTLEAESSDATSAADAGTALAPNEVVEIDEWILDFAALFREHLGIDAEAHLDLHAEVRTRFAANLEPFFFRVFLFFDEGFRSRLPGAAMTKTYTTTPKER